MQSVKPVYPHKFLTSILPFQIAFLVPYIRLLLKAVSGENAVWDPDMTMSLLVFGAIDIFYIIWVTSGWARRIDAGETGLTVHRMLGRPVTAAYSQLVLRNGKLLMGRRYSIDINGMDNSGEMINLLNGRVKVEKGSRIRLSHFLYGGLVLVISIPVAIAMGVVLTWAFAAVYCILAMLAVGLAVASICRLLAK